MIRCLKSARSRTFLLYTASLINPHAKKSNGVKSGDLGGQAVGTSNYNTSHAAKHVARAWISFRYLSSYNRCPHWSVQTCIKIVLSYSVHWWKHKFHKVFRYWNISMYFCIPLARTRSIILPVCTLCILKWNTHIFWNPFFRCVWILCSKTNVSAERKSIEFPIDVFSAPILPYVIRVGPPTWIISTLLNRKWSWC